MKAFIKQIVSKLAEFLQEENGRLSSMRLLFLAWGLGALVVWIYLSLQTGIIVALPISVTAFIGSLVAGKLVQNFTERDSTPVDITK